MSEVAGTETEEHYLCQGAMRDTFSTIFCFLTKPSKLRATCRFMIMCFDNAVYLELPLSSSYVTTRHFQGRYLPTANTDDSELDSIYDQPHALPVTLAKLGDIVRVSTMVAEGNPGSSNSVICTMHLVDPRGEEASDHHVGELSSVARWNDDALVEKLKVSRMPKLHHLGPGLLRGRMAVREVVLQDLSDLNTIGENSLETCFNLTSVKLSNLPALCSIGQGFLMNARELQEVSFEGLNRLQSIGNCFMQQCAKLPRVELKGLKSLSTIGRDCLEGCVSVEEVIFVNLPNLSLIGDNFLCRCSALKEFTFAEFPQLKEIVGSFLSGCTRLEEAKIGDLPSLVTVGNYWMSHCKALKAFSLTAIPLLSKVGFCWLAHCDFLQSFTVRDLPSLSWVGDDLLFNCPRLDSVGLSMLPELAHIGEGFYGDPRGVAIPTGDNITVSGQCHPAVEEAVQRAWGRLKKGEKKMQAVVAMEGGSSDAEDANSGGAVVMGEDVCDDSEMVRAFSRQITED